MCKWLPIKTAPKDKTIIYCDGNFVGTAVFIQGNWWDSENKMRPDFWMPLPPPPSGSEREENAN